MNIRLKTLTLQCKKSRETINFNEKISYFHGRIGTGKSSILRLINYCLGDSMERPPAIASEALSVNLECNIGNYEVLLERDITKNNEVRVTWKNETEVESINASTNRQRSPIYLDYIYNLSDLIFYFFNIIPVKFPRSRTKSDSPLITMSFKNLMWYCYLNQDDIDSSFYHLDEVFSREHSQNVMRYITGDHSEKINEIEKELAEFKENRLANINTVKKLGSFLVQFGYDTVGKIEEEIYSIEKNLVELYEKRESLRSDIIPSEHVIDELKIKLRNISELKTENETQINDLESKISDETSLKFDYINSKFKISRTSSAFNILQKVSYKICPQCGINIEKDIPKNTCQLCKQKYELSEEEYVKNIGSIREEIDEKIDELDEIINKQLKILEISKNELQPLLNEKESYEKELTLQMKNYDSIYLSQSLNIEKEIAAYEERIKNNKRIKLLPENINKISEEIDYIIKKEEESQKLYNEERRKLTYVDKYLKELETIFLHTLINSGFPGININDEIEINRKNWMPKIHSKQQGMITWDFYGIGSGGKKTLFNVCYALSIHILAEKYSLKLPNILIIDTPMKNIPEGVNEDIFTSFYLNLYELSRNELINTQFIIVDKEYFAPPESYPFEILKRYMTSSDDEFPGLVSYWKE